MAADLVLPKSAMVDTGVFMRFLGLTMPMVKLHQFKASSGLSLSYLKYDAMIAACALRCDAQVMIAIDGDHVALLRSLNVSVRRPEDFVSKQRELFADEGASGA